MGVSFVVLTMAAFMCAFAPNRKLGFEISYAFFVLGRFLLACATRGIALTGFVIGKSMKNFVHFSIFSRFRSGNRCVTRVFSFVFLFNFAFQSDQNNVCSPESSSNISLLLVNFFFLFSRILFERGVG